MKPKMKIIFQLKKQNLKFIIIKKFHIKIERKEEKEKGEGKGKEKEKEKEKGKGKEKRSIKEKI